MFGRKQASEDHMDSAAAPEPADDEIAPDQSEAETGDAMADALSDPELEPAPDDETSAEEILDVEDPGQRLAEELEALNDRYLRLAAEFDNFRRRTRKEAADLSVIAQMEMARRVLPAMDDLARVAAIPNETTTVEALDEGIELIVRNLHKELAEVGLERIEAIGERFDPELHQGMMVSHTGDPELDDTVSRVFVDGYTLRGRLVRPAQVEVLNYDPEVDGAD